MKKLLNVKMESKNIFDIEIENVLKTLDNEGIFLYPTDTIWGIGCDATNDKAVEKIYKIKQRSDHKALISLVHCKQQLQQITGLIPKFDISSQPTTIIYPQAKILSKKILGKDGTAGIRLTTDKFCKEIIKKFGKPIVSTSANISGTKQANKFSEISQEIKKNVDYIVNLYTNKLMTKPSRIFFLTKEGRFQKIR